MTGVARDKVPTRGSQSVVEVRVQQESLGPRRQGLRGDGNHQVVHTPVGIRDALVDQHHAHRSGRLLPVDLRERVRLISFCLCSALVCLWLEVACCC